MKFGCIIADPPWAYGDKMLNMKSTGDGAAAKYPCMNEFDIQNFLQTSWVKSFLDAEEIRAIEDPTLADTIADDAHLWLWTTNAFLEAGHRVARAWGFTPKTMVTWVKGRLTVLKQCQATSSECTYEGQLILHIGQGHYLRNCTEHCLFATRGSALPKVRNLPTMFVAPRGEHSVKPDTIHRWAEQLSPGPYLELFARRPREKWTTLGNEILKF